MGPLSRQLVEFVHHHCHLNQLDILEKRVPVDVSVSNDNLVLGFLMLQKGDNCNLVLGHHTVEDILCLPEIGSLQGNVIEFDKMLINQGKSMHVEAKYSRVN